MKSIKSLFCVFEGTLASRGSGRQSLFDTDEDDAAAVGLAVADDEKLTTTGDEPFLVLDNFSADCLTVAEVPDVPGRLTSAFGSCCSFSGPVDLA